MNPLKPLSHRTFSGSVKFGRILLGFGLARTGWFADDDPEIETRRHYILALRVTEKPGIIGVSLTVIPLYFLIAWKRVRINKQVENIKE